LIVQPEQRSPIQIVALNEKDRFDNDRLA